MSRTYVGDFFNFEDAINERIFKRVRIAQSDTLVFLLA